MQTEYGGGMDGMTAAAGVRAMARAAATGGGERARAIEAAAALWCDAAGEDAAVDDLCGWRSESRGYGCCPSRPPTIRRAHLEMGRELAEDGLCHDLFLLLGRHGVTDLLDSTEWRVSAGWE